MRRRPTPLERAPLRKKGLDQIRGASLAAPTAWAPRAAGAVRPGRRPASGVWRRVRVSCGNGPPFGPVPAYFSYSARLQARALRTAIIPWSKTGIRKRAWSPSPGAVPSKYLRRLQVFHMCASASRAGLRGRRRAEELPPGAPRRGPGARVREHRVPAAALRRLGRLCGQALWDGYPGGFCPTTPRMALRAAMTKKSKSR